jgi:oligoribonuclease
LAKLDEWNRTTHGSTGLLDRVRGSRLTETDAERQTLAFLREHAVAGASPMCGNSICQDRRFLARWMPALEAHFHYRNLDVSTLKELAARWYPQLPAQFSKRATHLALADIHESIAELRFYRERLFVTVA